MLVIATLFLLFACSLPFSHSSDSQCTAQHGTCQSTSTPCEYPSQYVNNICDGGPAVQCCLPDRDVDCTSQGGICQQDTLPCGRSYVSNLCSGPTARRCCLPNADAPCHEAGGRCSTTGSSCNGRYKSGLCGGQDRQCCIPRSCNKQRHGSSSCGKTCQRTPGFWYQPI